jgi:bacillolysin
MKGIPVRRSWLLGTCLLLVSPAFLTHAEGGDRDVAASAVRSMSEAAGGGIDATYSPSSGRLTFMHVRDGRGVPPAEPGLSTLDERALSFLRQYGPAFGLGPEPELRVTARIASDAVGLEHVRVQQHYKGLPVVGAELMVHLRGEDVVTANGKALPGLQVDVTPTVTVDQALDAVREMARRELAAPDVQLSAPELQILNRGALEGGDWPTHLAWFVVATNDSLREFVWVDAHRGAVVLHFSQRPDVRYRTVFTASNSPTLPGTLIGTEWSPPSGDPDGVNAFTYAGDTYDYYMTQFGRDSYDNAGAELRSTVHYCTTTSCPYPNAFWNGSQMVYGEGFASADDVVAHELTHAVTEHSANLFYYMQSGALNESYSDIFGETVDLTNGRGNDSPSVRWLAGEDMAGGAIRNMMNPNQFGDPGRMNDGYVYCGGSVGFLDGGGVHTNSGIPNHAYALASDGGTYNGKTVAALGLDKAARIEYRALTTYLMTASDFLDNYNALKQSCADLGGSAGITNADCAALGQALDAVEMSQPWACTPAQPVSVPMCATGYAVQNVWSDNLENVDSGAWTTRSLGGENMWIGGAGPSGLYWTGYATSGAYSFWGYGGPFLGDSTAEMASGVTLPANARLQFKHSFGFDHSGSTTLLDGGVIEYCTGACSSWSDAGSLISAGAAYNGTISTMLNNPLAGRSAFTQASWGYAASQLNLSSLAGQSVRFRFRLGTDSYYFTNYGWDIGWFIDDVQIYQCSYAGPAITSFTPTSGPVGTTVKVAGTNLTGATAVRFNGVPSSAFTVDSPTSITATVPLGATSGTIGATTPDGTATSPTSFTVTASPLPTITGFTPTSGAVGTPVTIVGTGFIGTTGVAFSGASTTFLLNSATSISTSVPAGATTGAVSVTTPGGLATSPGSFTVTSLTPLAGYFTLTPCRLVDTRGATSGAPAISAGETRVFAVAGHCGIPATATAVSVNLTVTEPSRQGNVRLFPAGVALPNVSTINYVPGLNRANNAIVPLNAQGELAVYCSQPFGTTHLVLDVNGYFQ